MEQTYFFSKLKDRLTKRMINKMQIIIILLLNVAFISILLNIKYLMGKILIYALYAQINFIILNHLIVNNVNLIYVFNVYMEMIHWKIQIYSSGKQLTLYAKLLIQMKKKIMDFFVKSIIKIKKFIVSLHLWI